MEIVLEVNDKLIADVMETGKFSTLAQAVERGLQLLILRKTYQDLRALRGTLELEDNNTGRES